MVLSSVIALCFFSDSMAQDNIQKQTLPDGVEHWYRVGKGKPSFFRLVENLYEVILPDEKELPFGKSVAFLVGVSEYKDKALGDLEFVKNDLISLREYLLKNGGFDEVYVATDSIATPRLVEHYMRNEFRDKLKKEDRLLFYYSGHGADYKEESETGYLLFSKAKSGKYDLDNWLPINHCRNWSKIQASHVLFIFDCCVSGLAFTKGDHDFHTAVLRTLSGNGSRTVITAGTGNEESLGLKEKRSVFTDAFLNALKKPENTEKGFVTITQIFAQVESEVKQISRQYGKTQTPMREIFETGKYKGTFLFVDTSAKNIELPQEYKEPLQAKLKGGQKFYGIAKIISLIDGDLYIDNVPEGEIQKGQGDIRIPLSEGKHIIEVRGDRPYRKEVNIVRGKPYDIIIEDEKPAKTVASPKKQPEPAPPPQTQKPVSEDGFTNKFAMKFVKIPAGSFMMGSPSDEPSRDSDETQHSVTISKPFYMQTTEVTQGQWKAIMGSNPSYFSNCGDNCPVEQVSWDDVQEFIKKLNQKGEGTYRLPTEAEWEYAARAGSKTALYTGAMKILGDNNAPDLDPIAWYGGNSCVEYSGGYDCSGWSNKQYSCSNCGTHPVGKKEPNDFGLYDMIGNVWEWCQDWKGNYPSGSVTDPTGPSSGSCRVLRGGSWSSNARYCRAAYRSCYSPSYRVNDLGFRLVFSS